MSDSGLLALQPWIRELILGSETLSSPRTGQLLKVLQDSETPGPSSAPDTPDTGAVLLVSDGTHSVRCVVTRNAIDTSDCSLSPLLRHHSPTPPACGVLPPGGSL
uniref:Adrenocortical dysplasia n=1 Tax=Mus musculus TaxID=10090 RepID=A0A1D5RM77_MOUSE